MAAARRGVSAARRTLAGAVLAGGRSRRMGRDKARLRVDGELLWRRQVRVLREAGAERVLVARAAAQRVLERDVRHVRDAVTGAGPLAGLQAALRATEARWVAVVAVDMPAVDAAWWRRLWADCKDGCGAVARHAAGYEPLAAIYPREALGEIERRLAGGRGSLQELVAALVRRRRMKVWRLPKKELWRVANWNRPADRATR
ncbi:MAG TPA: molybdenum cofactor guanylyltransferase [Opitutus sp.]|nr:molybdenum cofactor guanylyltransferase [Opitutus sp.]